VGLGLGPAGTADRFGLSVGAASTVALVLAALLISLAVVLCLRGAEVAAFCAILGASLAGSPLVWHHYLVVLAVPIAIVAPRLEWLWLLPAATVVSMTNRGNGSYHRDLIVDGIVVATLWICARRDPVFAVAGGEVRAFAGNTASEADQQRAA
jgi:hypothetical protein